MGGHNAGEVASKMAIETLAAFIEKSHKEKEITWPYGLDVNLSYDGNRLKTAVKLANKKVFRAADNREDYTGMGTTLVAGLVSDNTLTVGSAGDSRCYLLRGGQLTQLTRDDSWVSAALGEGILNSDEIERHPLRNVITKAIGPRKHRARRGGAEARARRRGPHLLRRTPRDAERRADPRGHDPLPAQSRGGGREADRRRQRGRRQGQRLGRAAALHGVARAGVVEPEQNLMATALAPRRFGRYEILGKLGEGAMGVVHKARDPSMGRLVALKMLSAELGDDDEIIKRFQREAEAIGRLSHPHIVTVYDRGEAGPLFMVMELLRGRTCGPSSTARR
jgi:hypothetical protein